MSKFIRIAQPKPDLGINSKNTNKICDIINNVLADQHVLSMKIHGFHWNIKSELFPQLHSLFDDQYGQLLEAIDATAERGVMLGGKALGSLKEMLANASLKEVTKELDAVGMIRELLQDHEACIQALRKHTETSEKLGDMGTNDFLIGLMQGHEKMAWFLRSMLK